MCSFQFNDFHIEKETGNEEDLQTNVSTLEGTFRPEMERSYCLTWTNPQSNPGDLLYGVNILKE
jgi:hypothetical protein